MLNSVLIEGEDPVNQNSGQFPHNHSGHSMIEYFQNKEINYPPKPVNGKKSKTNLVEFKMQSTSGKDKKNHQDELIPGKKKKRTILVLKKGPENIPMLLRKIVLIYTENKITYVFNEDGNKYIVEENLTTLAQTLDEQFFFRANRQYIININYIKSFRTYERVKLKIDLTLDDINNQHSIIISQESAPAFKKWIHSA